MKYMPPTKHMTGNIFKGYLLNGLFNLTSVLTGQGIHLLGMLTEAIHTPFLQDRYLALEGAKYVMNNARHLGQELEIRAGGKIEGRAREVLAKAAEFLARVADIGLLPHWNRDVRRCQALQGRRQGLEGVVMQAQGYCNPFLEEMSTELRRSAMTETKRIKAYGDALDDAPSSCPTLPVDAGPLARAARLTWRRWDWSMPKLHT